jgi:hypothetical protein
MEAGKYSAVTNAASVYKNKDNKLIAAFEFRVGENNDLMRKRLILFEADGMICKRDYKLIRELTGWDGIDPYWIQDNAAIEQWPAEVVVAMERGFKDPSRMFPNIQWVNTVRGGPSALPTSDRAAILAEFGPRLRAMAGPQPVMNSRHTPVKTAAPSTPPARVPTPAPTRPPPGGVTHTQTSCWEALQAGQPNASSDQVVALWYSLIGERDQATMTSADWAGIAEAIERLSATPTATDEEPMPF